MAEHRGPSLDRLAILDDQGHRSTVHPADVEGTRITWRRRLYFALALLFCALPWIRADGEPLILLDIPRRSFHLFGHVFNGQDGFLLFFLMTGVGFTLIAASAMFGRIWCGWACPQTVWLEGFYRRIERLVDGPALQRRRLDEAPWTARKLGKRVLKWGLWTLLSLFLGHTFVAYFTGAQELVGYLAEGPAEHMGAFAGAMGLSAALLFDMGWFREQTCIVLCPYGRLQSVLTDEDTIVVGYDAKRGEPRGKATDPTAGACVDCGRCISVCPNGIDIRNGWQMDCIGCEQCVDACHSVMTKLGRPTGLVRLDTQRAFRGEKRRFLRPRLLAYALAGLIGLVVSLTTLSQRISFEANVLRLQGAPFVVDERGVVTNPMMLHLVSKSAERLPLTVRIEGRGVSGSLPSDLTLEPEESRSVPVVLRAPKGAVAAGTEIVIEVKSADEVKRNTIKWMAPPEGR
ncbi:MAG: cytochrome c oxidase accessory protein CcoG [Deltaproteobacteria bacterium]|nr:cytochrome c oxidase accessory protein CcoG [Deltaproteobacteria bacterium]